MSEQLDFRRGTRAAPDSQILRWTLSSYEGRVFVDSRIWFRVPSGEMRPSKCGITIRLRELDAVIELLEKVREEIRAAETPAERVRRLALAGTSGSGPELAPEQEGALF